MQSDQNVGLTGLGKFISLLLIAGLFGVGGYVVYTKMQKPADSTADSGPPKSDAASPDGATSDAPRTDGGTAPVDPKPADEPVLAGPAVDLAETKAYPDRLPPAAAYVMKGDVVDVELSEYAGYAGLILANGGLDGTDDSIFKKKHGFKLKIKLSEEESWPALNQGKMGVSATTADVLAVYGRQFDVIVPAQIGFSRGADGVVVRSDIKRINQLKGKTLVTAQFTEADFFIRYLAQEAGLQVNMLPNLQARPDPNKLNLVFAADAFEAGDIFLNAVKTGDARLAGCVTWAPKTNEVAKDSGGKAVVLATNRNLLVVADVLIVNRGFAQAKPDVVKGIVDGLMEGNKLLRADPTNAAYLDTIGKAFKWDKNQTRAELSKVHLSNGPENLAFFAGAIDAAGSFNGIYNSAVLAYGSGVIRDEVDGDRFVDTQHLKALDGAGAFAGLTAAIAPIRSGPTSGTLENNPLLSKDIRFFFEPNSDELDGSRPENQKMLADINKLLQVSPGSTLLLRGHVDPGLVSKFREQGGEELVRQQALRAMDLSKRRAARVKTLLVDQQKIDAGRIDTVGKGWEEPTGRDAKDNMRVEVQWFTLE